MLLHTDVIVFHPPDSHDVFLACLFIKSKFNLIYTFYCQLSYCICLSF